MCRFKLKHRGSDSFGASFNTSYVSVQASALNQEFVFQLFQYILCVGSRMRISRSKKVLRCFNTSYVSVQDGFEITLKRWYFVSIHPMCRFKKLTICENFTGVVCFNTSYVSVQVFSINLIKSCVEFQYILCVGSRRSGEKNKKSKPCFNTSYVSVQVLLKLCLFYIFLVSIHPMCRFKALFIKNSCMYQSFNTSYVSVQGNKIPTFDSYVEFQYILCVGSSFLYLFIIFFYCWFQYILCVGSRRGD